MFEGGKRTKSGTKSTHGRSRDRTDNLMDDIDRELQELEARQRKINNKPIDSIESPPPSDGELAQEQSYR